MPTKKVTKENSFAEATSRCLRELPLVRERRDLPNFFYTLKQSKEIFIFMALLEIKKAGDPVLKQHCEEIKKIDKRIKKLIDDMAETMYASEGVGIAAPQVGIPIRLVVIDVEKKRYDMINPVITYREGSVVDSEGCLSCPNLFGDVERAEKVRVKFTTKYHKEKELEAEGLLARCIQHELDHLDGRLFIDIAKNITKGKVNRDNPET